MLDRLWDLNRPAAAAFRAMGRISGPLLLATGAAALAGAVGLLRGTKWGWWMAVGLFGVNGFGDAVSIFATGDWVRATAGAVIAAAFVGALSRARVRRFFDL